MTQALKLAPYGEPSFEALRKPSYAYVDKTRFIETLERCGTRFPFIVRPRRFGKSVFANMLMAYYDKAAKDDFAKNFAGTWIGEHPTPFANQYFVLKFDFSGIDCGARIIENFTEKVKAGMEDFISRYMQYDPQMEGLLDESCSSPATLLVKFLRLSRRKLQGKIYLIIDEYDQFAQEVLSNDPERFRAMTGSEGFLKTFYANIKDATQTLIDWVFITGVTSISLDSMTSGFNVAKNLSTSPLFAGMLGFTDDEVRNLIPQIVDTKRYGHSCDDIFNRMKMLYDGYRFSQDSEVTVFNSSMCLYYLSEIAERNREPDILLDPSFSIDLSKIDGILSLGKDKNFVEKIVLDTLFDRPIKSLGISPAINLNFSTGLSNREVLTALVFMGFLTLSSEEPETLVCPNRAVKDLFFQYWFWRVEHLQELDFPVERLKKIMATLANGEAYPLFEFVSEALSNAVGVHALSHLNEIAIQMATYMAVNTNSIYKGAAEEEALGVGFTDLILRPNEKHPDAVGWVMEFKYLKKSEATEQAVAAKIAEAEEQLKRYSRAENIANIAHLRRAAVVFSGTELKGLRVF